MQSEAANRVPSQQLEPVAISDAPAANTRYLSITRRSAQWTINLQWQAPHHARDLESIWTALWTYLGDIRGQSTPTADHIERFRAEPLGDIFDLRAADPTLFHEDLNELFS